MLPKKQAAALVLVHICRLGYKDVCSILRIKRPTLWTYLSVAKHTLRYSVTVREGALVRRRKIKGTGGPGSRTALTL